MSFLEQITITPTRSLGEITALVFFEEDGTDEMTVTDHPVERSAEISDHAYLNPARVTIRAGATNSSAEAGGDENYVTDLYQQILDLQATRQPFEITTGKRLYSDMVITSIAQTTDEKTEAALMVTVACRQIIIVQTQITSVPPNDLHANAAKTGAAQAKGVVQALPAKPSIRGPT